MLGTPFGTGLLNVQVVVVFLTYRYKITKLADIIIFVIAIYEQLQRVVANATEIILNYMSEHSIGKYHLRVCIVNKIKHYLLIVKTLIVIMQGLHEMRNRYV